MSFFKNHKSIFIISGLSALILCILVVLAYHFFTDYHINTVYVEGNTHYSDVEVRNMVMNGFLGDNSLFLSLKYKNKSIEDVPFVSKMSVEILDNNTIRIRMYEKAIAGYIEYLEKFMYFDKDGVVIEASTQRTKGIPQVTGLTFDHVVIKEPLPVEDKSIFESVLSITQLVNKYNLSIDRIYFGLDNSITLYFDDIKVSLGTSTELDEKVMRLQYMLPELEGKSGTLRMENYTEDTKNVSFEPDEDVFESSEDVTEGAENADLEG